MLAALLTFSVASALIVLLPGPDTLVVLRTLLREDRRRAVLTVVGVLLGLSVWIAVTALGLSALLRASETGFTTLRIVGAIYLVWLGVQSLRSRQGGPLALESGDAPVRRAGLLGSGLVAGLATDLLNPKVGVFFVTFLPGFVPHGEPIGTTSLLLGAVFIAETALYFTLLLLLAGRLVGWLRSPSTRRRLERATGLVLLGFGVRLAIES